MTRTRVFSLSLLAAQWPSSVFLMLKSIILSLFVIAVILSINLAGSSYAIAQSLHDSTAADKKSESLTTDEDSARLVAASDESIYVVQRRSYSKSKKFELTPLFYTAVNPKFVSYLGVAVSAAYHVKESLTVEFMLSIYNSARYSALVLEVYDYEQLTPESVDLKKLSPILGFGALSVQYSALYGKYELYGIHMDYDFYVSTGFGFATTLEPCTPNRDGCSPDTEQVGQGLRKPETSGDYLKVTANLGGGARVFVSDTLGFRAEVRDIVYADRTGQSTQAGSQGLISTDIRNNMMLFLGVSFLY